MYLLFRNLSVLLFLAIVSGVISGCATNRKPRIIIKESKPSKAYVPISIRQVTCVNNFLDKDVDILKANEVCQEIFSRK